MKSPNGIEEYAALWGSDRERYVLVRLEFPDGHTFYDIYGEYCTIQDESLNAAVAQRMRDAGTPVFTPEAWVLELNLGPHAHLWEHPEDYVIVRATTEAGVIDLISDSRGVVNRIYEDRTHSAVVQRMLAAGAELVETQDEAGGWGKPPAVSVANRKVVTESEESEFGRECLLRMVFEPSFEPAVCWLLVRRAIVGGVPTYHARLLTWEYTSNRSFRERVRLPHEEQGWQLRVVRREAPLDAEVVEAHLRRLAALRLPLLVDELWLGRDGTTVTVTLGSTATTTWSWWEDGPEPWCELVSQIAELRGLFSHALEGGFSHAAT
jgi:hypothetical protein